MRIHRHVPMLEELGERADVIEVAVGQDDGVGFRTSPKESFGFLFDLARVARQTRIDQYPGIAFTWLTDEKEIDEQGFQARYVVGDVVG